MDNIDFDHILMKWGDHDWSNEDLLIIKAAMTEACRRILALASEKAKIKQVPDGFDFYNFIIDKESIINCIHLINQ